MPAGYGHIRYPDRRYIQASDVCSSVEEKIERFSLVVGRPPDPPRDRLNTTGRSSA
jgi:hypothetical protein